MGISIGLMQTNSTSTLPRFLLAEGLISPADCALAQSVRSADLGQFISRYQIDATRLARAMAKRYQLPLVDLSALDLKRCPLEIVDASLLQKHQCLPLWQQGNTLNLALADASNPGALADIEFHTGCKLALLVVEYEQLSRTLNSLKPRNSGIQFAADELHGESSAEPSGRGADETDAQIRNKPLVRFLDRILDDAVSAAVSDIHFEPYESFYRIRYRQDGLLHEVVRPPPSLATGIASRLKVMARMNIAERRLPQDGRIHLQSRGGKPVDFRVSSLPTPWGEKIVLRNLASVRQVLGLSGLGMEADQLQQFQQAIAKPQGLVLVTGPTGSGKTQTLYAALDALNCAERNLATAEDPVERSLEGINQVAVNTSSGLDFARILRALLRQDPDVIMIGEIRDAETADIACKAAQTGHLVLSTLHTNSAGEALSRLAGMGVASYNLAASLSLLLAQRLLRRLCEHCKESEQLPENVLRSQGFRQLPTSAEPLYRAVGCEHCHRGYRGRVGIYEVVPVSAELSRRIMQGGEGIAGSELTSMARSDSLRQSALAKVSAGLTSLEEANRLT